MHEAIDATVEADEDSEVGDRLDGAGDLVALREVRGEQVPGVLLSLLDTERDPAALLVDVENHDIDLVAYLNDLGRMDVLVRPVHFGDVHQTFHALFDLDEAAVIGEVRDATLDDRALRIAALDVDPGVFTQLLETKRHPLALTIELQHANVDLVADADDFRRVLDPAPCHVRDVQEAVDTTKIHERAVVGEVLDDALEVHAFLEGREQLFALGGVLLLEHGAS